MIALIVAYTKNRVIGNRGVIPWNLKNEKKRFKALTTGNVVIMGRKTYEEIGRPLPDRTTVVVSTTENFQEENCFTVKSLREGLSLCREKFPQKDVYISGGTRLYKEGIPFVKKMFVTEIDAVIEGDAFFPFFYEKDYMKETQAEFLEELSYKYLTYTRINPPSII